MKQLYIECAMGASGDMLMSALYGICPDKQTFLNHMSKLNLPKTNINIRRVEQFGISGFSASVNTHNQSGSAHEYVHHHNSLEDIVMLIRSSGLSEKVETDACTVYDLIAEAEAAVHGTTPDKVHMHEVGNTDAMAEIIACCLLIDMIAPDYIVCSPVHVGSGHVRCAHGTLPVPTPATAQLLSGVPIYSGDIQGELCTPTGAALIKHFARSFSAMPLMTLQSVGYGFGQKEFSIPNCVRVFLGESDDTIGKGVELKCNIDDMTGEALGAAIDVLLENGARDVFFTPIQMKKNRPAVMLTCLSAAEDADRLCALILAHTTTFGVRRSPYVGKGLPVHYTQKQTPYGLIRIKHAPDKSKPEYDDVLEAAKKAGVPFNTVWKAAMKDE